MDQLACVCICNEKQKHKTIQQTENFYFKIKIVVEMIFNNYEFLRLRSDNELYGEFWVGKFCNFRFYLQQRVAVFLQNHSIAVTGPKRTRRARSGQGYRAPAYRVVPGPARGRWTRIGSGGLCVRSCESPWIGDKFITAWSLRSGHPVSSASPASGGYPSPESRRWCCWSILLCVFSIFFRKVLELVSKFARWDFSSRRI